MLLQLKNSNLLTTVILKKYKAMPYWSVLLTQLQKRFCFNMTFLASRCSQWQVSRVKLSGVNSVASRCLASFIFIANPSLNNLLKCYLIFSFFAHHIMQTCKKNGMLFIVWV